MNKEAIVEQLTITIQSELDGLEAAYKTTKGHATEGELKADSKWDTRAIEAGYLADAQKGRVEDLKSDLEMIKEIEIKEFKAADDVAIGALVELDLNGNKKKYFIAPTAGGSMLNVDGEGILVISVFSPIGAAVLGHKLGDTFELEAAGATREYEITAIW